MKDNCTLLEGKVIQINEQEIKNHLNEMVRSSVEETLNRLLDEEAQLLCQAERYERSEARQDQRAGYYKRKLITQAGEVKLKMPKLRQGRFETAIIERYRRRESSVEEAMVEMYLAGVSTRRIEDITEALWGSRVSAGTISHLNQKIYEHIEAWRQQPIEGDYPYVYLDGIVLKRCFAEEVRNVSVLVAVGVNEEGYRRVLGIVEGIKEDYMSWNLFLRHLKERGLKGVQLFISDACLGLQQALNDHYCTTLWQRCTVHFYRNVFAKVPKSKVSEVSLMLKAIHAQEDLTSAKEKARQVIEKLQAMKLHQAAKLLEDYLFETLTYYQFPKEHWRQIKTNNPLERVMREIRRRTRVVGVFPDGQSAVMLCAARLRHIASTHWGVKRYMNMQRLTELNLETLVA